MDHQGFTPSMGYPPAAPHVQYQEYRGYYPNSLPPVYHDAPEATTTKFSYATTKPKRPRSKYRRRNNFYRNYATSATPTFNYDDYNEEDIGDYNGYDYALEAEQKRESEQQKRQKIYERTHPPSITEDYSDYEEYGY